MISYVRFFRENAGNTELLVHRSRPASHRAHALSSQGHLRAAPTVWHCKEKEPKCFAKLILPRNKSEQCCHTLSELKSC